MRKKDMYGKWDGCTGITWRSMIQSSTIAYDCLANCGHPLQTWMSRRWSDWAESSTKRMNNIRARTEEMIREEMIFVWILSDNRSASVCGRCAPVFLHYSIGKALCLGSNFFAEMRQNHLYNSEGSPGGDVVDIQRGRDFHDIHGLDGQRV